MMDETIDIADRAKDSDQALCAKMQIEPRWRAASKYDPEAFGEASRSNRSQTGAAGALIDEGMLRCIQDRHEEKLLGAAQKAKVGRPSRARGSISP
jgi:hypothetical protein